MNIEKILYHAKFNGEFTLRAGDYWEQSTQEKIDQLLEDKLLVWQTNELFAEYQNDNMLHLYDDAIHAYKITAKGEIRLALFRLVYALKSKPESIQSRGDEVQQLIDQSTFTLETFYPMMTKAETKLVKAWHKKYYNVSDYEPPKEVVFKEKTVDYTPGPIPARHLVKTKSTIDDIELDEPVLTSMFNMSVGLGKKDSNKTRSEEYVLRKTNEELGEMTLEMNIRDGLSYKEAGKDGVKGEAVDLAICAMDMFALQCDGLTPEEMEREFLAYMIVKLNKWRDTLK